MNLQEARHHEAIIGEDGELLEAAPTSDHSAAPIYCTQCGAGNRAESRFCRTCGQSLDEQILAPENQYLPARKSKLLIENRQDSSGYRPENQLATVGWVAVEIVTMVMMTGIIIALAVTRQGSSIPVVLGVWFLVALLRRRR